MAGVYILLVADRDDSIAYSYCRISVKNGLREITAQQNTDISDHQLAMRCHLRCYFVGHYFLQPDLLITRWPLVYKAKDCGQAPLRRAGSPEPVAGHK